MLKEDVKNITQKTGVIALLYKDECLVDKFKSDAVKIYLTYHIELANNEFRSEEVHELKKEIHISIFFQLIRFLERIGLIFQKAPPGPRNRT